MKIFLEKYVMPLGAAPITWAITEKLQLNLRYQIAVIAFGVLAGFFASCAIADEKTSDPAPESTHRSRVAFIAYLFIMLLCIGFVVLFIYVGTRARLAVPSATSLPSPKPQVPRDSSPTSTGSDSKPKVAPTRAAPSHAPAPQATPVPQMDEFLQRYVDTNLGPRTDRPQWAFVVSDGNHSAFPELGAAAAESITEAGYRNVALFRPALVRDGNLEELYGADPVLLRKLGPFCDGVIVAVVEQTPVPDTGVQGLSTVEVAVRVRAIAAPSGTVKKEFSVLERGAGFTAHEAERNARERVAQDLRQQLKASF
jgi:hypothetical protein